MIYQISPLLTARYSICALADCNHHAMTALFSLAPIDSRPKGRGFEPHRRHCVVSLSKNINPSLVLVQPRKTRPYITERLLMGRKESNQTKQISSTNGFPIKFDTVSLSQVSMVHCIVFWETHVIISNNYFYCIPFSDDRSCLSKQCRP